MVLPICAIIKVGGKSMTELEEALDLCTRCGLAPRIAPSKWCRSCITDGKQSAKERVLAFEEAKEDHEKFLRSVCTVCHKPNVCLAGFKTCSNCRARSVATSQRYYVQLHLKKLRDGEATRRIVLEHYNNCCACCGNTDRWILQIDHVNNDGGERRKTGEPTGIALYKMIIRLGFPPDFQLLCANCNYGKQYNGGICPHKEDEFPPKKFAYLYTNLEGEDAKI
jgi:hypothetical protein